MYAIRSYYEQDASARRGTCRLGEVATGEEGNEARRRDRANGRDRADRRPGLRPAHEHAGRERRRITSYNVCYTKLLRTFRFFFELSVNISCFSAIERLSPPYL